MEEKMNKKLLLSLLFVSLFLTSCGQDEPSPTSPFLTITPLVAAPETVSDSSVEITIQWTQGEAEDKLFLDSGGGVDTEVVSVGSPAVEARRTGNCQTLPSSDGNEEPDCVMQFRIDDSVLFAGSPTTLVRIEVEYYDQGTDSFFIQYDAAAGAPYGDGTINETELFSKTDSGSFKTAVFTLEDVYFANRINGADFRIDGMDDGAEIIRSIKVTLLIDPTRTADTADIIFYNGNVITIEEDMPQAEAIAIQGDEILAVGSDTDILLLAGPNTQLIDLSGLTIIPGFVDTHTHLQGGGSAGHKQRRSPADFVRGWYYRRWTFPWKP
jgi:hypothetical protein